MPTWREWALLILPALALLLSGVLRQRQRHRQELWLQQRELSLQSIVVLSTGAGATEGAAVGAKYVSGSMVVAMDRFSTRTAWVYKLFGGRWVAHEICLAHARRVVICQLKEDARRHGCQTVCGVRFVSTHLTGPVGPHMIEVMACGMALPRPVARP